MKEIMIVVLLLVIVALLVMAAPIVGTRMAQDEIRNNEESTQKLIDANVRESMKVREQEQREREKDAMPPQGEPEAGKLLQQ